MTTDQERIERLEETLRTVQKRLRRFESGTCVNVSTMTTDEEQIERMEVSLKTVEERLQTLQEGITPRLERVEEDLSKIAPRIHTLTSQMLDRFDKVNCTVTRLSGSFAVTGSQQSSSLGVESEQIEIIVMVADSGTNFHLNVEKSDTIDYVKALIQDKEGIPPHQQRLEFERKQLVGERTLAYYKIWNECPIHLLQTLGKPPPIRTKMPMYVKTPAGKTITLEIERSYTVQKIKYMIQDKAGIPSYEQSLVFGNQLQDGKTLADQNIHLPSLLHLTN